jgi:hypothetical protein
MDNLQYLTTLNTLGTGYLNCLYAYKRKSASPVLNVLTSLQAHCLCFHHEEPL